MKFCKKYEEYMRGEVQKKLPGVGFKKLKKTLKRCHRKNQDHHQNQFNNNSGGGDDDKSACPHQCTVCDGTFFPALQKEMSEVMGCFNERAERLLELHLASGFRKCFIWFRDKFQTDHIELIQEGKDIVDYGIINSIAMRKILKKYDKIHDSNQGQAFKSQAQSMHIEILQSPWLCELMAFHINLRETKTDIRKAPALFQGCSLVFKNGNPSLTCELFDSVKLDIDLTCSICLETVFDPVSLTCGHIFCYMCTCKAGSVTIVDGLKAAKPKEKCPLCREIRVYEGALHLEELNILLSRKYAPLSLSLSLSQYCVMEQLSGILEGTTSKRENREG